ncbi:MAG: transcriptional repressor [Candidatus Aminicenantes bacterium]|nr:MAG: transcriptional repressor [Candidatus Aminicenantes bacterium]
MSGPRKLKHRFEGYASRLTAPREAILEFLSKSSKHMSAKEIYASLHGSYPGIGLSTVYRTLDLLARMGIVTKLAIGDGQSRYEFKSKEKDEHHHHLICTNCGKIINYSEFLDEELGLVKKTEERLAKKYNFIIQDHNIEFLGICEKCK